VKTALVVSVFTLLAVSAQGQQAGDPFSGLTSEQRAAFDDGKEAFEEEEDILDGLGPIFNGTSCAQCHSNPTVGGDSNIVETRFGTTDKNKFDALGDLGGSLIQSEGIGKVGACTFVGEVVPPGATIETERKTTPLFGLGLVDAVPDSTFEDLEKKGGKVNRVLDPVSGTRKVGKFGWKAQVSSLLVFAAEAYVNEMGITSPLFPAEQCPNGDCALIAACDPVKDPEDSGDDVEAFENFMTLLAPISRGPTALSPSVIAGEAVFNRIGCAECHVSSLTTGPSPIAALNQVTFHPYSDFLLHHMGTLGDGIEQGKAAGDEMRTAPLWGLRFRSTFLHDGRATTHSVAIEAHDGAAKEAAQAFGSLTAADRQALLDFLGSL
jgi:CxxC motif-containing protein (DUF1111 family)